MFSFHERLLEIMLSLGHTEATSIKHYLGIPFTESNKEQMKTYIGVWKKLPTCDICGTGLQNQTIKLF